METTDTLVVPMDVEAFGALVKLAHKLSGGDADVAITLFATAIAYVWEVTIGDRDRESVEKRIAHALDRRAETVAKVRLLLQTEKGMQ